MCIEPDRRASFVLITGLGRSGSTIVQRALTVHPSVFIADEAWHVYGAARLIASKDPRHFMGLDRRQVNQWLGAFVCTGHRLAGGGKQWVGDKCPAAIRYIDIIGDMFADAGIDLHLIFTLRHPYDCALSWYERFGSRSLVALAPYTDLRPSGASLDDAMWLVLKVWAAGAKTMITAAATSARVVLYESLVAGPRAVLDGLCAGLGVAPEARILEDAFNGAILGGDPKFAKTQAVHTRSVDRHLTCDEQLRAALDRASERLGAELFEPAAHFGYRLVGQAAATSP
jgi:hypothetical protein